MLKYALCLILSKKIQSVIKYWKKTLCSYAVKYLCYIWRDQYLFGTIFASILCRGAKLCNNFGAIWDKFARDRKHLRNFQNTGRWHYSALDSRRGLCIGGFLCLNMSPFLQICIKLSANLKPNLTNWCRNSTI